MKRALLVGIDDYEHVPLKGCASDAERLAKVLERHENGDVNFACKQLCTPDFRITRAVLRKHLEELFLNYADIALFYFSGHGMTRDMGGILVTQDAKAHDEGVPIKLVLDLANEATVQEVVIILDCCHSGSLVGKTRGGGNNQVYLREGISILTASSAAQRAAEDDQGGIFTTLVCDALEGGAADLDGDVTIAAVYAYVDRALNAWDLQRPLLISHVSRLITLRQCSRSVEPSVLRLLPTYFPSPEQELALDPSFEPDAVPHNEQNERIFTDLQKLRAARLLVPVGEEHMYFAAINSRSCRLTPQGKYYWRLAKMGKL